MVDLKQVLKTFLQLTTEERAHVMAYIKDKDAIQKGAQLKGEEKTAFYEEYLNARKGTR